jgi:hypothetical protein
MPALQYNHDASIRIELLPGDTVGGAFLKQTVALQVWTDVLVTEEVSIGLSVFEKFTLECLLQLGTCRTEDLCEVVGIGSELARWWLDGVEAIGLARRTSESTFVPNIESCIDALASNSVQKQEETEKTMVWFPQTSELLVLNQQDTLLRTLSTIDPTTSFPLPDIFAGESRGDVAQNALKNSLLYGNGVSSIVAVQDTKKIDDTMCPAYQLEMDIAQVDSVFVKVNIFGYPARKGSRRQNEKRDLVRESMHIPRLSKYVDVSRERVRSLSHSLVYAMEREGLLDPKIQEGKGHATLDYDKAREVADQALLDCNKRISFVIDGEIEYVIPLTLVHSGRRVAALINLDTAVKRLLAEKVSTSVVEKICGEFDVTQREIVLRLWRIKQYAAIYQLREEQDFFE